LLTDAKELLSVNVRLGQGDAKVPLKKHKHRAVILIVVVGEVIGVGIAEPILSEDVGKNVPPSGHPILESVGSVGKPSPPLNPPQSLPGLDGKGGFGIGVHRLDRPRHPPPETLHIKPPDLPRLFKRKISQGVVPVLGFAGKEILVIRQSCAPKNSRSRQSQATPKKKSSGESLKSDNGTCVMKRRPENWGSSASVTGADRKASQCRGPTLIDDSHASDGSTPDHLCFFGVVLKVEVCCQNGSRSHRPLSQYTLTQ
jgi:hypothetical protein